MLYNNPNNVVLDYLLRIKVNIMFFRFLVFGLGKRGCIGDVFAKSRTFLFLSTLLRNTTIIEPEGKSLIEFDPRTMVPGLVIQPQPFEARFVVRFKRNS